MVSSEEQYIFTPAGGQKPEFKMEKHENFVTCGPLIKIVEQFYPLESFSVLGDYLQLRIIFVEIKHYKSCQFNSYTFKADT